jgi:hypothetical protein
MFGQGVSTIQQVEDDPPRKVILIPDNKALQLRSTPKPERRTFTLVLGPVKGESVTYHRQRLPYVDETKEDAYKLRDVRTGAVQFTWSIGDMTAQLRGHYYCRVEHLTIQRIRSYIGIRDQPAIGNLAYDPLFHFDTSFTSTELNLSANEWLGQHVLGVSGGDGGGTKIDASGVVTQFGPMFAPTFPLAPFDPRFPVGCDRVHSDALGQTFTLTTLFKDEYPDPNAIVPFDTPVTNTFWVESIILAFYPAGGKYDELDSV